MNATVTPAAAEVASHAADAHGHTDSPAAAAASPGKPRELDEAEMKDMKLVVLDSAELATRAAGLAAQAGSDLRGVSQQLVADQKKQAKLFVILLGVAGLLMVIAAVVFAIMSVRLQSRVSQLDAMVLAVGKRVVEMDASMEMVGSVQEALKEVVIKQTALVTSQAKIDERLEEVIKGATNIPELTAKQVDGKTQAMTKQVQALDSKVQSQASSLKELVAQMKGMQTAMGDAGAARRELDAITRQQRERQAADANATTAAAAAAKARERMLQYPRVPPAEKP